MFKPVFTTDNIIATDNNMGQSDPCVSFLLRQATQKVALIFRVNLKAYSLMSNRGRSQNFQNLKFLHIFVALL